MNYTELKSYICQKMETQYSDEQLAVFVTTAEQVIQQTVSLPAGSFGVTGSCTAGNRFLTVPTGFLNSLSLAVQSGGRQVYLMQVEVELLRAMYPDITYQSVPKYYALWDKDSFVMAPTPNSAYVMEHRYTGYPPSITVSGNSWLGDNFPTVLQSAAMVEACSFDKSPEDMVTLYQTLYTQSLALLKNWIEGRTTQDVYVTGVRQAETK